MIFIKRFAVSALIFMLIFCGCQAKEVGKKDYPAPMPERFEASAELTVGDFKALAHVVREGFGAVTVDFSEPSVLSPLTVTAEKGKLNFKYNNISFSIDDGRFPESLYLNELLSVFDKIVDLDSIRVSKTDEGWLYSGEISGKKFEMLQSRETGLPQRLSLPELSVTLTLSNVTLG